MFLVDFITFLSNLMPISVLKIIVYFIAILLLMRIWKKLPKNFYAHSGSWGIIGLYLFLLFLRLLVDFIIPGEGFFLYKSPSTILFFFAMTMVLPYFFCKIKYVNINESMFCVISSIIISICLAISLKDILNGSLTAVSTSGQYAAYSIDIISYGHYGLSLLLISVYMILFSKKTILKLFFVICALIGISGIVLSGSRSPIIALFICGFLVFISKYKKWYFLIPIILLGYIYNNQIISSLFTFNNWLSNLGIGSFSRILNSLFGDNTSIETLSSGRNVIYELAISLFYENFILGYGYLLPDKSYVHNLFIENFMALGFWGGMLFLIINILVINRAIYILKYKPKYSIYVILFIQYLVLGFFSRTTIAIAQYWLFLFLILNIYNRIKYENRICSYTNI